VGADYVGRAGKAAGGKGGEKLRKKSTVGGKGRRGGEKRLCWAVTTSSEKIKMIVDEPASYTCSLHKEDIYGD